MNNKIHMVVSLFYRVFLTCLSIFFPPTQTVNSFIGRRHWLDNACRVTVFPITCASGQHPLMNLSSIMWSTLSRVKFLLNIDNNRDENQLVAFKPRICGPESILVALNWDTLLFQHKLYLTVLRCNEILTWLTFCWVSVFLLSKWNFPFPSSFRDERLTSLAFFSAGHCVNFPKIYRCTSGCN